MSRRRWLLFVTFVLLLTTLGLLETQRILTGWFTGEAFFQGRPTSYWRGRLLAWQEHNGDGWWADLSYPVNAVHWAGVINTGAVAPVMIDVGGDDLVALQEVPDAMDATAALGEKLAWATSPTPWLIARPDTGVTTTTLMVDSVSLATAKGHFRLRYSAFFASRTLFRSRPEQFGDRIFRWLGIRKDDEEMPAVLQGDAAAVPVVR